MTNKNSSDDFIIKPLSPDFDIRMMRQLIAQWRVAGLTDSQIVKMQLLYFGEPAWMSLDKMYDCTRFNQIAEGMRFHCRNDFVELLLKCRGFGRIWKNETDGHTSKNLLAFYSPLWHKPNEEEMEQQDEEANMQDLQKQVEAGGCYNLTKDIYYKKKNIQKKNDHYLSNTHQLAPLNARAAAERERIVDQAARELISGIALNDDAYTQIVKPVNEKTQQLMPELYTNPKESHPTNLATRCFFNSYVYPYLMRHGEKLMKISTLEGRCCWLRNLMRLDFMQKNILLAVDETRQQLRLHAEELRRQHRPLSPYEYQDQASGQRFYDFIDPKDGSQKTEPIPRDAEKRPSATARWNKFTKEWKL